MATKIVTKNSSTSGSAPSASDLVQGELAVNVVDKRLYTENNSGAIVELGTNPAGAVTMASTLAVTGNVDFNGDLDVDGTTNLDVVDIDGAVDMASTLAVGGVVTISNGSVSAPAIAFASDTDTGIYRGGTNTIAITAGGSIRFYADASTHLGTVTAGTSNLTLGVNAGNSIASGGNYNVVVGDEAGTAITTGDNNVAVGYGSSLDAGTPLAHGLLRSVMKH